MSKQMRDALAAFEVWADAVIPMLGDSEAADFGRDRIAQSQSARTSRINDPQGTEPSDGFGLRSGGNPVDGRETLDS